MNRKEFIQKSSLLTGSLVIMKDLFAKPKGPVYGHQNIKYTLQTPWAKNHNQKVT
jgi:hypothetical protein